MSRSAEKRHRTRTTSALDAPYRHYLRAAEARLKRLLIRPLALWLSPAHSTFPVDPSEIGSILFFRHDALGDAILSTPAWRTLKRYAPHIKVGVVGTPRNADFLRSDKDIDEVFVISGRPGRETFDNLLSAGKKRWDLAVNLFFHDKTWGAIYAHLAAPKGRSVTGVRGDVARYTSLYSHIYERQPLEPLVPMARQNLEVLLSAVSLPVQPEDFQPTLTFRSPLPRRSDFGDGYVLVNTEASQDYKEWGLANSLAATRALQEHGRRVVWTSSPSTRARVESFLSSQAATWVELLDTPALFDLFAAIRQAATVVSPDTSVVHIAAALGTPVVGLYLTRSEFLPTTDNCRVLISPDGRTVSRITVDQVVTSVAELDAPSERR